MRSLDSFKTRTALTVGAETFHYYSLTALARAGFTGVERLPYSLKILLENLLRREDDAFVKGDDIRALASWDLRAPGQKRSPSCRRGSCSRTSRASPASSTWPRCATVSSPSAAIPTR